jgi:hypothetical protein
MAGLNFITIFRKAKSSGKIPGRPDARDWLRNQARKTVNVNVNKLLQDPGAVDKLEPGKLYMFAYDPKFKDKLPYYDVFPLVFPFKVKGNRVWGINLHYLPPQLRAVLMDELYGLVDNRFKNENKKLGLSYEILNGASRFDMFKPCVKSYLSGHFRSKFLLIPYDQWDIALMLPTARFQKAAQSSVWEDSISKINGDY